MTLTFRLYHQNVFPDLSLVFLNINKSTSHISNFNNGRNSGTLSFFNLWEINQEYQEECKPGAGRKNQENLYFLENKLISHGPVRYTVTMDTKEQVQECACDTVHTRT